MTKTPVQQLEWHFGLLHSRAAATRKASLIAARFHCVLNWVEQVRQSISPSLLKMVILESRALVTLSVSQLHMIEFVAVVLQLAIIVRQSFLIK